MKKWLIRIAGGFVIVTLLLALLALDFVSAFRRSVPSYDGVRTVEGLNAPVRISRDRFAIPHISAASFEEAQFGLGYAHAQDRMWQMEMSRRYIQGRLAEFFGAEVVATDVAMRGLGLYRAAEQTVTHLTPDTRRALEFYAAGVNAWLAEEKARWPVEFTFAGTRPEPWRPADSVAVLKGMALMLSGNASAETARVKLLSILGKAGVEEFVMPFDRMPLPDYVATLFGGTKLGDRFGIRSTSASNNWVVGGAHSMGGKPLLANDPHLGLTIPSTWYLAHLASPGEDFAGGTLPGIPGIVAGRNRHVAWGMTNTEPDTEDLYLERLHPDNARQYQTPAGWAEFETRVETVVVRFGGERQVTLRTTRHGPVMEDAPGTPYEGLVPRGYVLALASTALTPDDTTMDAILGINRAADAAAFRTASNFFIAPMQNVVFADDSGENGRIGLVLPGRVPLRSESNDSMGLVPAPGWDVRYDWQGFVPAQESFRLLDPPSGRIATANNRTVPESYPHIITREWDSPYRFERIEALLAARPKHSVDTFKAIQLDDVDTYALILTSRLMAAAPFPERDARAARLLQQWDGTMRRERPEPLIFAAWARALSRFIHGDELGPSFHSYWGYRPEFTLRVLDNVAGQARWCDDRISPDVETCASRIRLALATAVDELSAAYGPDPSRWRWGDAHRAVHEARPFGGFPLIGPAFNREGEKDGGAFTILRADHRMSAQRPYAAVHGAGYRGIYDLADPDRSLYIISTGQSGNLYSPHYDDLLPLWAEGGYVEIPLTPQAVRDATVTTVTLQPPSGVRVP